MNIFINHQSPKTSRFSAYFLSKRIGFIFLIIVSIFAVSCSDEIVFEEQHTLLEKSKYKTVKIDEALNIFQESDNIRSKSGKGINLQPNLSELRQEKIFNTNEYVTIIPANTIHQHIQTNIILIKYQDSILKVLINLIPDSIKAENFSGILSITDLTGKFINGYRVKNGIFITQFIKHKKLENNIVLKENEITGDCDESLDPDSRYCDQYLDEVTLGGSNSPSGTSLSALSYTFSYLDGVNFVVPENTGGGGTGTGSGSIAEPVFPCDDPIHGCIDLTNDCNTSIEDLKKIFPNTPESKLAEVANAINKYGHDYGLDTKEKLQHFLTQAGHESNNFTVFEENLNYNWKELGTNNWNKYFNPVTNPFQDINKANPNDFKKSESSTFVNIEKFANYIYNDANRSSKSKLGNTAPGDGYKYRGRGILQLTGKINYSNFSAYYQKKYDSSKDFVLNPELISSNMEIAVLSALWFFENKVENRLTINNETSVEQITKLVNGGLTGIKRRNEIYSLTKISINCL